ncbi:DNA repair protein RecN [Alisedimentitalea sp. MJ-SS2]|uniref:DNA repair protein RecN n=1 Tax=Aliisedimentitalea sp. MJ-SS2 TaxID=3049795 RepID=UPI00290E326A|nr:DNA repair protein RecN [Alisedimentitalea sp. MJ-SS2]MDU8928900.1 DNA repair protein RecN [Alisedimentitalea sp. MJ-SS2]
MLRTLEIRDMLIIDRLDLEFRPGLNVLTGETGAGKSILLDSLGFVLGWRGRAELVRAGAEQGEVTAEFDLPNGHAVHAVLAEAGLPQCEDGTLLLRRVNGRDGRKTAWVNDRRCSGEVLRQLSDVLVELHGQHDDRGLLNPRGHRALLDEFAGNAEAIDRTRKAWAGWRRAEKELGVARAALEAVRDEEEFLRHAVGELDALDPQPGEDEVLDRERRRMQAAERVREDIDKARGAVSGGDGGAEGAAEDALRWLEAVAGDLDGLLDEPVEALGRALNELAEAGDGIRRALDALDFEPFALEACEERLFAIRALARKHDVLPDELGSFAMGLRDRLDALERGDADIAALEEAEQAAKVGYDKAAAVLSGKRARAAKALDKAVMAELAPLKMERAVFVTEIDLAAPGPEGMDAVSFTVATNPGAPSGPIAKIASGGELSRFLLALKVSLAQKANPGVTMIFDEIDRGVGGATADAVGRRLAALAEGAQVLVVTHSPQVAAQGGYHWRVEKRVEKDMTLSTVVPLNGVERVDEIARMLSGDVITDEARAAAERLLG